MAIISALTVGLAATVLPPVLPPERDEPYVRDQPRSHALVVREKMDDLLRLELRGGNLVIVVSDGPETRKKRKKSKSKGKPAKANDKIPFHKEKPEQTCNDLYAPRR